MSWEEDPPQKVFKPRSKNLTILESYTAKDLGEGYWAKWDKNPYDPKKGSLVNHEALMRVATRLGYADMVKVRYVCSFLKDGASLEIEGEGRWPSVGKNNNSVAEAGARVADSLQAGLEDGYLSGPLTKEELDILWPEGVKICPMMVTFKANGSARIIMDLSWPRGIKLGEGKACSPNEGMRNFKEFEEVQMTTDKKFRKAIFWAGWPVEMLKTDWSIAYKHIAVLMRDHRFQLVEFGGRYFVELCLTFGGCNSPTLFNMVARMLIELACLDSGMDSRHSVQQLDDNCAVASSGSKMLWSYLKSYRSLAEELGIRLAPEDDPSKAFPPSPAGEILGIEYDGEKMTWAMPASKGQRLLVMLGRALTAGWIRNDDALSLAGRVNHYSGMVHGKFNRCLIIHLGDAEGRDDDEIRIKRQTKLCLVWWLLHIRVLQKCGGLRIPYPDEFLANTALILHTDAAGGASRKETQGWGMVNLEKGEWARGSWPKYILNHTWHKGSRWGKKLTFLEGFTGLLAVPLWAAEIQEAGGVALMIDNIGFCYASESGCSRDEILWTISKAVADLAEGLGVPIRVFHTARRTSLGDKVADDLSKGKTHSVMQVLPGSKNVSCRTSKVLLNWLAAPRIDMELGRAVLLEIAAKAEVEVQVGLSYEAAALELGVNLNKWG